VAIANASSPLRLLTTPFLQLLPIGTLDLHRLETLANQ
jgi:hypothetical protein